ncbi:MAG: hypothetical protein ABSF15_28305 [Candidatus Sulfotelmatobacter sp.]|jgi:predicted Zn-dependent protease
MPTPWLKRIASTGQLTVFNKAGAWTDSVNTAIASFNNLAFGVSLVAEKKEKSANIVVILANGPEQYRYGADTIKTTRDFTLDWLHGETITLTDHKLNAIFFAAVFLPGKSKKPTKGKKEVIIVHEFIHACGIPEHEKTSHAGIMYDFMAESNDGLKEATPDGKEMPPIRVGPQTLCRMQMLWSGAKTCKP